MSPTAGRPVASQMRPDRARIRAVQRRRLRGSLADAAIVSGAICTTTAVGALSSSPGSAASVAAVSAAEAAVLLGCLAAARCRLGRHRSAEIAFAAWLMPAVGAAAIALLAPTTDAGAALPLAPLAVALVSAWTLRLHVTWLVTASAAVAAWVVATATAGPVEAWLPMVVTFAAAGGISSVVVARSRR